MEGLLRSEAANHLILTRIGLLQMLDDLGFDLVFNLELVNLVLEILSAVLKLFDVLIEISDYSTHLVILNHQLALYLINEIVHGSP